LALGAAIQESAVRNGREVVPRVLRVAERLI
jgi:hypothetical protein